MRPTQKSAPTLVLEDIFKSTVKMDPVPFFWENKPPTLADPDAEGLNAQTVNDLLTMYVGATSQHVLRMSFVPEEEALNFDTQVTAFWSHLIGLTGMALKLVIDNMGVVVFGEVRKNKCLKREHKCQDPKNGEQCLNRAKSEETLEVVRTETDVCLSVAVAVAVSACFFFFFKKKMFFRFVSLFFLRFVLRFFLFS